MGALMDKVMLMRKTENQLWNNHVSVMFPSITKLCRKETPMMGKMKKIHSMMVKMEGIRVDCNSCLHGFVEKKQPEKSAR